MGLDFAVGVTKSVEGGQTAGNLREDIDGFDWREGGDCRGLRRLRAHDQGGFGGAAEELLVDFQINAFAEEIAAEWLADLEFEVHLFDEFRIFFGLPDDMLHGMELAGLRVTNDVHVMGIALTQSADDVITKEALGPWY